MVECGAGSTLPSRIARVWIQGVRPIWFTASAAPVLLGAAIAATQGLFNPGLLLLTLLGAVAVQRAANFFGDRDDHRAEDTTESYGRGRGPVPGVRQTSAQLALDDPAVFMLFGPLAVLGAYYVQARSVEITPVLYALPIGCLATDILEVNNIRILFDGRNGRARAARAGGLGRSKVTICGLVGAAYLLVVTGVTTVALVRWSALALLSAPLAWGFARQVVVASTPEDAAALHVAAARVHLVFSLLLVVGVLLPIS